MYFIRSAEQSDAERLLPIARALNSVNLPADIESLREICTTAEASFRGELEPDKALYLFVLVDGQSGYLVGSSMIIAGHGSSQSPHHFFQVEHEERICTELNRTFRHRYLKFRLTTTPHTELGGLVLSHQLRRHPLGLGRALSYVRFLYMAAHPERFHDEIQAELLGVQDERGRSPFWECVGRPFTGLPYDEADQLSRHNHRFIPTLFPRTPIYTALLPEEVQRSIGCAGQGARASEHILRSIGFRPNSNIDPFDGGPHLAAQRSSIPPFQDTRLVHRVQDVAGGIKESGLIASVGDRFRADFATWQRRGDRVSYQPVSETSTHQVYILALPPRSEPSAALRLQTTGDQRA